MKVIILFFHKKNAVFLIAGLCVMFRGSYSMEENKKSIPSLKQLSLESCGKLEFAIIKRAINEKAIPEELSAELAPRFAQKVSYNKVTFLLKSVPVDCCVAGLSIYCSNRLSITEKKLILYKLLQPLYAEKAADLAGKNDSSIAILESIAHCVNETDCSFLNNTKNNLLLRGLLFFHIVNSFNHYNPLYSFLVAQGASPGKVMKKILIFKDKYGLQASKDLQKNAESLFDTGQLTEHQFGLDKGYFQNPKEMLVQLHAEKCLMEIITIAFRMGLEQSFFKAGRLIHDSWFCDKRRQERCIKRNILNFLVVRKIQMFFLTKGSRSMLYARWMMARWGSDEFKDRNLYYLKRCASYYREDANRVNESFIENINDKRYTRMYPLFTHLCATNELLYFVLIHAVIPYYKEEFELREILSLRLGCDMGEVDDVIALWTDETRDIIESNRSSRKKASEKFWQGDWPLIFKSFCNADGFESDNMIEDSKEI
jgi:hypothetical protein